MTTLALTTACGDNQATGPASSTNVPASNATFVPVLGQEVTIRLKDITGHLIPDGMISVEFIALTANKDTVKRQVAYDNHLNPQYNIDLNATGGIIAVRMPMAAIQKVCLYNTTYYWAFEGQVCTEVTTNGASKVDAGSLVMRKKPVHIFVMKDGFGMPIKGGRVHVKGPVWFDYDFEDGGVMDPGAANGQIEIHGDRPGTYEWCEVAAPSGYLLAKPTCGTLNLVWEGKTSTTLYHMQNMVVKTL
jgi:hypothetical protein